MLKLVPAVVLACLLPFAAFAQPYPAKPVRVVVPYAAGGATDTVARAAANRLAEVLGQPVVVENRAGAGGVIGADNVAKAAPDGYSLLLTVGPPHGSYPLFTKAVPFDTIRDFTPIAIVGTAPQALVAHPSVPAANVRELVDYAKKNPGRLAFATAGTGSSQHLGGVLLNRLAGLDLVHVPYKGGGPALNDLLGGQVPLAIVILSNVVTHAKSGKVKLLAVIEAQRAKGAPEVPTIGETVNGYALPDTWIGLVGPAALPAPIVSQLHAAVIKTLGFADVRQRLEAAGFELREKDNTPQAMAELIGRGFETYKRITQDAGIRAE